MASWGFGTSQSGGGIGVVGIKWLVPQRARLEARMVGEVGTGDVRRIAWEQIACILHGMYELTRYCVMDNVGR